MIATAAPMLMPISAIGPSPRPSQEADGRGHVAPLERAKRDRRVVR